jgi:hypothetical protein
MMGSPCKYTAFPVMRNLICGVCLTKWGMVHGNEKLARSEVETAVQKTGV